jgi:hypothetical protein
MGDGQEKVLAGAWKWAIPWLGGNDGFDDPAVWSLWVLYVLPMGREEYRP